MLRVQYPRLFAGTPDEARAGALARRVFELTEFLAGPLDLRREDKGPPLKVVLHNSCSARREIRACGAASDLLGRLSGVDAVEPAHGYECCGFGGTFAVKQPEISAAMTAGKVEEIAATGADVLVSQDCGCLMNLGGTIARRGGGPAVKHIAELLWERTGGD
jgi:L-lactate dehydrogenase complex protein LldE